MSIRKVIAVSLVMAFLFAGFASAEWKSLDNSRGPANLKVNLISSSSHSIKVEVVIPGYHMKKVMVDGKECVAVHIPGSAYMMKAGFPMVPMMSQLVKVHDRCDIQIKVLDKTEVEVKLPAPIVPSKGHLNRDVNPENVPFEFGPIYTEDTFWPEEKEQFSIGKAFFLRETRGVRLQVLPILANHVQMKMKVLKKAVLELVCEGGEENALMQVRKHTKHSKTFRKMYRDSFLNYEETEEASATSERGGSFPDQNKKNLVVIVPTQFEASIADWVAWKKKCGYNVTVNAIASGTTASTIKTYLQGLYNDAQTRFAYVVLIGDAEYTSNFEQAQPMPTFKGKKEGAAADRVYVRLAGDDNYPDAFISRISDTTADGIKAQLAKIMAYEQNPPAGDWYTKGICIASDQGSPTDKERAEWIQNGGGTSQKVPVEKGMLSYGYTAFDDIYDPSANATLVGNAVNNGRSVIFYIGHGSSTSWVSSGFSVNNVKSLTNGGMLPVIWSVACVNGDFVKTKECFGEAWLRKTNGGAAAMECASTNESWVPPCDKQAATINAMTNKTHFTFGALEAVGAFKGLDVWDATDSSEGNKMAEQCNLFGDCTMLVRTKKPVAITANLVMGLDNNIIVKVMGEERAVENATVTVYTSDLSFSASLDTNADGEANISLENMPAKATLMYTIVGPDLIPVIDQTLE